MAYTVYVIYSLNYDKIYIGYAPDLNGRLSSHNELGSKGWTIRFRP
ncbi:GIY-YIG nuclease family protein [Sphingobacterium paludis]|nr:GIY-YIG nuclease family protein [Sphingobacterium paludis]